MLMPFELITPTSLDDAVRRLKEIGKACKVMAGGTDVLVAMHGGFLETECIMDIKNIQELKKEPCFDEKGLVISALTTHDQVEWIPAVGQFYLALKDGVSRVGSVQTRMRGTIGGNICNAAPSGESLGPLLALDASLTVYGTEGERIIPFEDFFLGAKKTDLHVDELLCSIHLPPPRPRFGSAYTKFVRRKAMDLALLGVTVCIGLDENDVCDHARIALTTAAPTPMRAKGAEAFLIGKKITQEVLSEAGKLASKEATPRSSWRAPADYRHALIEELVPRTGLKALERMQRGGAI